MILGANDTIKSSRFITQEIKAYRCRVRDPKYRGAIEMDGIAQIVNLG